jgi:hypothetical protein
MMSFLRITLVGIALAGMAGPASAAEPPAMRNPRGLVLPAPIRTVLAVQPFRVAVPWRHGWRADRPEVREGWIVVLEADPSLVRPRQTEQAVLMAGAMTLEVVHVAVESGTVVAILPREAGSDADAIDSLPFHLAMPALPESLAVEGAEARRAAAVAAGIGPRGSAELTRARGVGGPSIEVADREELDRAIGAILRRMVPAESARADELEGRVDPEPRATPASRP